MITGEKRMLFPFRSEKNEFKFSIHQAAEETEPEVQYLIRAGWLLKRA